LGKALFRELDMKEVSDAYEQQSEQMAAMGAVPMIPGGDPNAPLVPVSAPPLGGPTMPPTPIQ
ncbi:MAG: hypothetical protein AAB967_01490, partial [Patescibacteria group bacterium]